MPKPNRPFEAVVQVAGPFIIRRRRSDQATQLNDEGLVVGPLADRDARPVGDEGLDIV